MSQDPEGSFETVIVDRSSIKRLQVMQIVKWYRIVLFSFYYQYYLDDMMNMILGVKVFMDSHSKVSQKVGILIYLFSNSCLVYTLK